MPARADTAPMPSSEHSEATAPRAVAAVGLAGVALIHLLDSIDKFAEVPYMGWMYVGLIVATLATAAVLVRAHVREAWIAAAAFPAAAIVGFVLTRTVGLPQATGDIGNWSEPLGLASLFVEGAVVALSVYALAALHPVRWVHRRTHPALSREAPAAR